MSNNHQNIKELIRSLLATSETVANRDIAARAGVSSQAVHYHLAEMVRSGELIREGAGRATRYRLGSLWRSTFLREGLEEDRVWEEMVEHLPSTLSEQAIRVLRYAVTEMVNNAIDHSESEEVEVLVTEVDARIRVRVRDWGVGIFRHLREHHGFADEIEAIGALSKGKLTTQPARHSGEGIFFTSKMVDRFRIDSGNTAWAVDAEIEDYGIGGSPLDAGTAVTFEVLAVTSRSPQLVFDEYSDDSFTFARTRLRLGLFAVGREFISRSEAKRIASGLERFSEVLVDFSGVTMIGQGFADELFRVWQARNPQTRLVPIGASETVALMVRRATMSDHDSDRSEPAPGVASDVDQRAASLTSSSGEIEELSWETLSHGEDIDR